MKEGLNGWGSTFGNKNNKLCGLKEKLNKKKSKNYKQN
jgi:hypothetical protein